jgi:hypothetical protein
MICPWTKYVFGFHLETNVMIAVLVSTTATVIGLFYVITSHIFYRGKQGSKKKE